MEKKDFWFAKSERICRAATFWLCLSLLVLIPLAFDTKLHRTYAVPKLALLLVGASALLPLIAFCTTTATITGSALASRFKSTHVVIVGLYMVTVLASTVFSADQTGSLFGHFYNQMGFIPRFGFLVCFASLIIGIDLKEKRLKATLWAMTFAGLLVSAYAVVQFFGYDPFLSSVLYTSASAGGSVVRVVSTLGHADYLGNFLLYTTPLSSGLAFAAKGWTRALAWLAAALSAIAIVSSGTRGAWFGLLSGAVVFAILNLRESTGLTARARRRQVLRAATIALAIVAILSFAISLSPAARSIVTRARLSSVEGFTGAGRTYLWRDSIKMVPAFALTGSGPDNFRKAFLPYKSRELGRLAPVNNESSHNSYLDAAISFGVPGFLLYVAIVVSTFMLLIRARRKTTSRHFRLIIAGIVSSFAAVAVHNFFIFDQISTGLYFFAFAALAEVISRIVYSQDADPRQPRQQNDTIRSATTNLSKNDMLAPKGANEITRQDGHRLLSRAVGWSACIVAVVGLALLAAALWYSSVQIGADAAIDKAMMSADAGDLDQVITIGERGADVTGTSSEHRFLFARALVLCADRLEMRTNANGENTAPLAARDRALQLAMAQAQKSLAHTQTPDLNYLFLASLALITNDVAKLRDYANQAVSWDPNHFRTHWMLAEAYLAIGDRNRAIQEAENALDLNPTSSEARSVLVRARGEDVSLETRLEEVLRRAAKSTDAGETNRARRLLDRALRLSGGRCAECHRMLALICEADTRYDDAIAQWQIFMKEAPDRASAEKTASRVEALKQKR